MNYALWFDDKKGVLYIRTTGMLSKPDIDMVTVDLEKGFEGKTERLVLVDVSESPVNLIDRDARRALRASGSVINFDKIALVGAVPTTRMIAKIAMGIIGKSDVTKFFKTEEEALRWLKE